MLIGLLKMEDCFGDELGCQGIPTLNLEFMPKTTAMECKKYLMERTNASRGEMHRFL